MSPTRRDAIAQLAALAAVAALPRSSWALGGLGRASPDPLDGTIADYLAGLRRGDWSAAEVTAQALDSEGLASPSTRLRVYGWYRVWAHGSDPPRNGHMRRHRRH